MTNSQVPAEGIMLQKQWSNGKSYTIACDCGGDDHNVSMWIEVEGDKEIQEVITTFYVQTTTPWYSVSRWRQIWDVLTKGYVKQESTLILSKQSAANLASTIKTVIIELENK